MNAKWAVLKTIRRERLDRLPVSLNFRDCVSYKRILTPDDHGAHKMNPEKDNELAFRKKINDQTEEPARIEIMAGFFKDISLFLSSPIQAVISGVLSGFSGPFGVEATRQVPNFEFIVAL
jgi:hypothetical protein